MQLEVQTHFPNGTWDAKGWSVLDRLAGGFVQSTKSRCFFNINISFFSVSNWQGSLVGLVDYPDDEDDDEEEETSPRKRPRLGS